MRGPWLGLFLGIPLAACCATRTGQIKEEVERAGITGLGDQVRLALCGWNPTRYQPYDMKQLSVSLHGTSEQGTGEATGSLAIAKGYVCTGGASFTYRYHNPKNRASYTMVENLRRVGAPAAIVAEVEKRATPIPLSPTPFPAPFSDWKLADGTFAVAYRFDVAAAGKHCVHTGADLKSLAFTVYQDGLPIVDPEGGISSMTLAKGPALLLLVSDEGVTFPLRVTAGAC